MPRLQNCVPRVPRVPRFGAQTSDFGLWLSIFYLGQFGPIPRRKMSILEHVGFKGFLKILIKIFDSKNVSWPQTGLHAKFQPNLTIFRIF